MAHPLYVAFLWHQHQPDYRDPFGGAPRLPWARLHAAKDYLHMAELVADFPAIHCTFNFVPSLVEQLAAIGNGRYVDAWQQLSLQGSWTLEDKQFLLDHFFSIHPRLLERYPAYSRLRDLKSSAAALPDQYFIDLAACFNLAWIDPRVIARDETLRALAAKGAEAALSGVEGFTRDDIAAIITKHRELAARVIPFHRELAARGQIEISLSPYYHPILPLLIDSRTAREALPNLTLPVAPFAHPEDAAEQIRRAVAAYRKYFGGDPQGMWPSEGSFSDALLGIINNGFRWLASDENLLARSLGTAIDRDHAGHVTNPRVLYQTYASRRGVALIFRDHFLSDRIGFAYQSMSARDAAQDLIRRLHVIRERIADSEHAYLVPIILDGENAWESYEDNGDKFFRELYTALSNDAWLRTVTISEYLRENPPRQKIQRLAAGSWINGNFDTWIGEPSSNRAWELLAQTRAALATWQRDYELADEAVIERAWDELYIAEGSDWFWWYSSHNTSAQDAMFDELFRGHLQNVYAVIGLPVPDELKEPIRKERALAHARGITVLIAPTLSGAEAAAEEWDGAAVVEPEAAGSAMQRAETKIARVFLGYSAAELFFRIETRVNLASFRVALYLSTPRAERHNSRPRSAESHFGLALAWEVAMDLEQAAARVYRADGQEVWKDASVRARVAARGHVIEIALSREDLRVEWSDTIGALVALAHAGALVETLPAHGLHAFVLDEFKV